MNDASLNERITRSLAFMLRHKPERFDLEVDAHGFADVDEVLRALDERLGEHVEREDLVDAVESGDRQRYEIAGNRIRALYGHSIPVEPGPDSRPPELLYVAIPARDLGRARRFGLRGGRRSYLHLALDAEDAREAGRRSAREYTLLTVRALDAWEDGVRFYDRKALFLAEEVPTEHLEIGETFDDGEEPGFRGAPERESDGQRGGRGRRGRRRGGFDSEGGRDGEYRASTPRRGEFEDDRGEQDARRGEERGAETRAEFREPREARGSNERSGESRGERGGRRDRERSSSREERPRETRAPRGDGGFGEERPRRSEDRPRRDFDGASRRNSEGGSRRDSEGGSRRETERPAARADARPAAPRREPEPAGDFGAGVFEAKAAPEPKVRSAAPAPPEARPTEPVRPAPERPADDFGGFGAGL